MTSLTLRAEGPAPAENVWTRYAVPALWPTWSPQIRTVRVDGGRIAPGMRGEVVSFLGVSARFVVESVDEERRRWTWRVRLGPVRLRLRHAVLDRPAGSATTLRIEGPALALAAYAGPARWAMGRLVGEWRHASGSS
ncbi:polyketide cyclase/dehydrase [Streptomyces sp. WAC04657]|uniref:SRPBCC family protein n=1 Tax=unclassified Streptomyces TaxID=2593676 RepID=UPI000786C379|nr:MULTISPECIES: SRPBCC family protein [unclassified Streptomyces]KYG50969.1 polyketide cyclase/dehydrase [Streptomyces sp. WAC04657]